MHCVWKKVGVPFGDDGEIDIDQIITKNIFLLYESYWPEFVDLLNDCTEATIISVECYMMIANWMLQYEKLN